MTDFQVNIYHNRNVTTEFIKADYYIRDGNVYTFKNRPADSGQEPKEVAVIHLSHDHTAVVLG